MRKVWVVISSDYDEWYVAAVFDNKEAADIYAAREQTKYRNYSVSESEVKTNA